VHLDRHRPNDGKHAIGLCSAKLWRIGTKTVSIIVPETKFGFPLRASNVSEGHNPVKPQEGVLVQHTRHFFATESHWFGVE